MGGVSAQDAARLFGLVDRIARKFSCNASEAINIVLNAAQSIDPDLAPKASSPIEFGARTRRIRARRNEFFGVRSFRDPSWDMFVDILVAQKQGRNISVIGACAGAGVPTTTALRHLDYLIRSGLILRQPDATDQRRYNLKVSDDAAEKLVTMLTQLQACA